MTCEGTKGLRNKGISNLNPVVLILREMKFELGSTR